MLRKRMNNDVVFWATAVDLLFMPYFNIVVIPYSYFIMLYWLAKNWRVVKQSEDFKPLLFCASLMCISTMWGAIRNAGYGVNSDNIKRLLQYVMSFGYLIFFRCYFKTHNPQMKRLLWTFVLFVVGLAIIFQYAPNQYSKICSIWNKGNAYVATSFIENLKFSYVVRYGFIWTDQNNIAYAITGIIIFMIMCFKCNMWEKMTLMLLNAFVLFCSMSSGGWIGFAISWVMYLLYLLFGKKIRLSRRVPVSVFIQGIIVVGILFVMLERGVFSSFLNSDIAFAALDRLAHNENTRGAIWSRILKEENIFTNAFWGSGATILINGVEKATHSGHLYWIYAYGILSYAIFMAKAFWLGLKKLYRYIPILSFFLCFTMNTMVGEQKLLLIYFMIFAYLKEVKNYEQACEPDYTGIQC